MPLGSKECRKTPLVLSKYNSLDYENEAVSIQYELRTLITL